MDSKILQSCTVDPITGTCISTYEKLVEAEIQVPIGSLTILDYVKILISYVFGPLTVSKIFGFLILLLAGVFGYFYEEGNPETVAVEEDREEYYDALPALFAVNEEVNSFPSAPEPSPPKLSVKELIEKFEERSQIQVWGDRIARSCTSMYKWFKSEVNASARHGENLACGLFSPLTEVAQDAVKEINTIMEIDEEETMLDAQGESSNDLDTKIENGA